MKKHKAPKVVTVTVLTLITSVIWVFFSIYKAYRVQPSPVVPANILQQLTPTLNLKTIEEIGQREFFDESKIPQSNTQTSTVSATPIPKEINPTTENGVPVSTQSGQNPIESGKTQ